MTIFRGSDALRNGELTRFSLSRRNHRVLPDVYTSLDEPLALADRVAAAALWSRQQGVFTGLTASAIHGSKWVSADAPIELNHTASRSPSGIITRRETLLDNEIQMVGDIAVTTAARTAFDLARRGPVHRAIERLDALARATHFTVDDVMAIAAQHPHVHGLRRLAAVLELVDAGAESPRESWLRLVVVAAGFPRPETQIAILAADGYPIYWLDMGWEQLRVTAEYDGQQHRTDPVQYRGDVTRSEYLSTIGWHRIAVLAGDRPPGIVPRIERAGVPRDRSKAPRILQNVRALHR